MLGSRSAVCMWCPLTHLRVPTTPNPLVARRARPGPATPVTQSLNVHFKLEKGKYVRTHHRLDVQPTGRFLVNLALESAMARATFVKPSDTGLQD